MASRHAERGPWRLVGGRQREMRLGEVHPVALSTSGRREPHWHRDPGAVHEPIEGNEGVAGLCLGRMLCSNAAHADPQLRGLGQVALDLGADFGSAETDFIAPGADEDRIVREEVAGIVGSARRVGMGERLEQRPDVGGGVQRDHRESPGADVRSPVAVDIRGAK
jgi:hypothetical protein